MSGDAPGCPDPAQWVTPGSQAPQKPVLGGHGCPAPLSCASRPIPGRSGECSAGTSQGPSHPPWACWLPPVEVEGQTDGTHSRTNSQAEQERHPRIPPSHLPWALPTNPKPAARRALCLFVTLPGLLAPPATPCVAGGLSCHRPGLPRALSGPQWALWVVPWVAPRPVVPPRAAPGAPRVAWQETQ